MTGFCTCPGSLASSLERSKKRKKLAEASCKTCGGRFAVDGIGAISRSMVGTVGLKVASSSNQEFNWKTVTKGKRSRKAVARCMNRGLDMGHNSPKRVGDFSGSDSDKFGETGNGQCLSDKAEYVPLKKRRHFLRSPSPSSRAPLCGDESISPQVLTPSSHSEELLSDHNGSSGSYTNGRACLNKVSGCTSGGIDNSDNLSGIALLAAAACFNNIDEDASTDKLDATEVSSAPQSQIENMQCSESGKHLQKLLSNIDDKECSFDEGLVDAPRISHESKELDAVKKEPDSPKVDRLHWDLNTSMDAWEQPDNFDVSCKEDAGEQTMVPEKEGKEGCTIEKVAINQSNDVESCLPMDKTETAVNLSIPKLEQNDSECCIDGTSMKGNSLSILHGASRGPVHSFSADTEFPRPDFSSGNELAKSPKAESCHSSEVAGRDSKSDCSAVNCVDIKCEVADTSLLSNVSDHKATFHDDLDKVKFGVEGDGQAEITECCLKTTESADNMASLGRQMYLDSFQTPDTKSSDSGLQNDSHPSTKHASGSANVSLGAELDESSDAKGDCVKLLVASTLGACAVEDAGSQEILAKQEDPRSSSGESGKIHPMEESGTVPEDHQNLEVGYDSPYEDGELRVSVLNFCEENEFEDGDQECLDYESEGRAGDDSDGGEFHDQNTVEVVSDGTDKKSLLAITGRESDFVKSGYGSALRRSEKENSEKTEASGEKASNQGSGTTEEMSAENAMAERNSGVGMHHTSENINLNEEIGEVRSKSNRGKLLSRVEGPSTFETMDRDVAYSSRYRDGDTYLREERDGASDRFVTGYRSAVHSRGRNEEESQCGYWSSRDRLSSDYRGLEGGQTRQRTAFGQSVDKVGVDSRNQRHSFHNTASRGGRNNSPDRYASRFRPAGYDRNRSVGNSQMAHWGPRMRYSYHDPEDNGPARPRCAVSDSFDKFAGYNSYDRKQSMNSSSRMMQGPPDWRRSPVDRDDYSGPRRVSRMSGRGNRGGSRKFIEDRGFREEYLHPMSEESAPSVRTPNYAPWRERKFLPHSTRGAHSSLPRRSSRSRSRTRSPRPWLPQRERDVVARHHSRSPDFRSGSQIGRGRVPFQNPSFEADYGDSFVSPPRGRFSPQRNFRRAEDPNISDSNLRHRRSPFNGYRQFRPESQMGRGRVPFQNSNFEADYGDSFVSPPRGRFSPQRNFRRADDQNMSDSHVRDRRSPFNGYRQGQRMDSAGISGRLKLDDSFRPVLRPGRFTPVSSAGRGCKLEDGNEEKPLGDRTETVQ